MAVETAPFTSSLAESLSADVLDRFLRYARVFTTSARGERAGSPSTERQLDLARILVAELQAIGIVDAELDSNGYVMATVPSNTGDGAPVIGVIAHMDTSPDAPGEGVEPIVHRAYDGGVIELPKDGTKLDPVEMPNLAARTGYDIVTSSGDTLLGADDKAGVAAIMAAAAYLMANPELPRPTVRIGFTPDEEIGLGASLFDIEKFGARCAYTIDGSELGELQDETFGGKEVTLVVGGVDVHPGFAKNKLVNAMRLMARIIDALPADTLTPETTDGREGYIHPYELEATAGRAKLVAILRDFDPEALDGHLELLRRTAEEIVATEPRATLEFTATDQYPNMRRYLERDPEIVDVAERALRAEGIEPVRTPIRGGTDGSLLSSMGLPTPNLFAGGHDFHSVREWIAVQDLAAAAAVIVRLMGEWAAIRPAA